jgi:hypothetical protein
MLLVDFLSTYGKSCNERSGIYVLKIETTEYANLYKIGSAVSLTRRFLAYATAFRPILKFVRIYAVLIKPRNAVSIVSGNVMSVMKRAETNLHSAYSGGVFDDTPCGAREWCRAEWAELRNRLITYHYGSADRSIRGDGGVGRLFMFYTDSGRVEQKANIPLPLSTRGQLVTGRPRCASHFASPAEATTEYVPADDWQRLLNSEYESDSDADEL